MRGRDRVHIFVHVGWGLPQPRWVGTALRKRMPTHPTLAELHYANAHAYRCGKTPLRKRMANTAGSTALRKTHAAVQKKLGQHYVK